MSIIFLKEPLLKEEINRLTKEFIQYSIISSNEINKHDFKNIEIAYTEHLSAEELQSMPALRWIHSPVPSLDNIPMDKIIEQGNILVTSTKEKDVDQAGHLAIGAMISFAKQLFRLKNNYNDNDLKKSSLEDSIWSLNGRKLLQIGLGPIGTNIAKHARHLGLTVWGAENRLSYHPYCNKTFKLESIHSLLPHIDVISISIPRDRPYNYFFGKAEIELTKNDSILLITGCAGVIDEEILANAALSNHFRGVLIDTLKDNTSSKNSPLYKAPNILITPHVGSLPPSPERIFFSTFLFNLRLFIAGQYREMKNLRIH